jgi:Family of unknown function (DUF6173)
MPGNSFAELVAQGGLKDAFRPPPLHVYSLSTAQWMYERLAQLIIEFEKKLDPTKEVGAKLANFGEEGSIAIEGIRYWEPDLVILHGKNSERNAIELLQHVTQANLLLVAVPTQSDPPRRIGSILEAELAQSRKDKERKENQSVE